MNNKHWWSNFNWNAVGAIASAFAVFFAFFTVLHTINLWREQERANRPYFKIEEPRIKNFPNNPLYWIQIIFYNIGKRPANNFEATIISINLDLEKESYKEIKFSTGNDIPPNSPMSWLKDLKMSDSTKPMFIVVKTRYGDSITKNYYTQNFFLKWNGVTNNSTILDLTLVSIDDKNKIENALKNFR